MSDKKAVSENKKKKSISPIKVFFIGLFLILLFSGAAFSFIVYSYYKSFTATVAIPHYESIMPKEFTSYLYLDETDEMIKPLIGEIKREYVSIDNIPEFLQNAVIASEDKRFYEHDGVDYRGMLRAAKENIESRSLSQGASTITQQIVKLNVLRDLSVNFERKLKEQYIAMELEKQLAAEMTKYEAKRYILEAYLNSVNLGHGTYGVQAASKYYFEKSVWELDLEECSVLAAIVKNPTRFSPFENPDDNLVRRRNILFQMLEQGYITENQYVGSVNSDIYTEVYNIIQNKPKAPINTYYEDSIIMQVANDLMNVHDMTREDAYDVIYNGGITIYSAMDTNIQYILNDEFSKDTNFPRNVSYDIFMSYSYKQGDETKNENIFETASTYDKAVNIAEAKKQALTNEDHLLSFEYHIFTEPQGAMVIVDYNSNTVAGLIGGRGEKTTNRSFNRATDAKRQPGSVFKILASYAPALDTGVVSPSMPLKDTPLEVNGYKPRNWNGRFLGNVSLRQAIRDSMNVVAVKTLLAVGYDTSFSYLQNFGFTTLIESEVRNNKTFTDKIPSLALGGVTDGVTLLELTTAYSVIANDGVYNRPYFYTKVLDHDGNVLLSNQKMDKRVLKSETADILTDMMVSVVRNGTGSSVWNKWNLMPIAGKTGTTTDTKDLVFVGYSPYYTAGLWIGADIPRLINKDGTHFSLWRRVNERIHEGLPYKEFDSISFNEIKAYNNAPIIETQAEISSETAETTILIDNQVETSTAITITTERTTQETTRYIPPQTTYIEVETIPETTQATTREMTTRSELPMFDTPIMD